MGNIYGHLNVHEQVGETLGLPSVIMPGPDLTVLAPLHVPMNTNLGNGTFRNVNCRDPAERREMA